MSRPDFGKGPSGSGSGGGEAKGRALDFTEEERDAIQRCLRLNLGPEFVSYRPSPGGGKVAYLEGWRALELANETFGFSGWSSSVRDLSVDFLDQTKDGKFNCGVSAVMRIELLNGTFHEDVGYGTGDNQKSKAAALEKAKKEAITDAIKRTLRMFGNSLGNCFYDKEYLNHVKKFPAKKREYKDDAILREEDIISKRQALEVKGRPVGPKQKLNQAYAQMTAPRPSPGACPASSSSSSSSSPPEAGVPVKAEPRTPPGQEPAAPEPKVEPEEEDFSADIDLLLAADAGDNQAELDALGEAQIEVEAEDKRPDEISSQPSQLPAPAAAAGGQTLAPAQAQTTPSTPTSFTPPLPSSSSSSSSSPSPVSRPVPNLPPRPTFGNTPSLQQGPSKVSSFAFQKSKPPPAPSGARVPS